MRSDETRKSAFGLAELLGITPDLVAAGREARSKSRAKRKPLGRRWFGRHRSPVERPVMPIATSHSDEFERLIALWRPEASSDAC